jgi:phthiocerol/phenolphthiocerol synthesis type-I polyketide synthase E
MQEQVAIIGLSLRFPGARNESEFWWNLEHGVESLTFFSDADLDECGVDLELRADPQYVKVGFVLNGVELFDAPLFGLTPREAEILDPQHRIFLECAWEALENAGYHSSYTRTAIGVFGGVYISSYLLGLYSRKELLAELGELVIRHANDKDYLTTRASYLLNLKGPSVSVQTSCSTGLVSVHLACQSLLNGECDMALAGASCIRVPERQGYQYQAGGILSRDGHCRAFDAGASGTVFGNGVGMVVLKRLSDAIADRDHIRAVIRSSAVNNDGSDKVGFTAPSFNGQASVIAEALSLAEVQPDQIGYIETHGTGTLLGDPIEIAALRSVYDSSTRSRQVCPIASVKTNIGHLGTAAGVAGLIKTVLCLENRQIPPSLNFSAPNPEIDFASGPFLVNTELRDWPRDGSPRLAALSSFGMGGTNAHMILQEASPTTSGSEINRFQLLIVSAKTGEALDLASSNLAAHLERTSAALPDVAFTAAVGRPSMLHRRAVIAGSASNAAAALRRRTGVLQRAAETRVEDRPVILMFPDQGSQTPTTAQNLSGDVPEFRKHIDDCSRILNSLLGVRLSDYWLQDDNALRTTRMAQPATFVIAYALARMWKSWGIDPVAMIGHSLGEYVAACMAGVFSLEDALRVITARGRLMDSLPPEVMLSTDVAELELAEMLSGQVTVAAVDGPNRCVVTGPAPEIEALERRLTAAGHRCQWLHVSHALHSPMLDGVLREWEVFLDGIPLNPPSKPFISCVTGNWIEREQARSASYWARQLRTTVRFSDGIRTVLEAHPEAALLECGPGQTLSPLVRAHPQCSPQRVVLASMRNPQDRRDDFEFLLSTAGGLWSHGVLIDWPNFYSQQQRCRVPLPTYPFERRRYWIGLAGGAGSIEDHRPAAAQVRLYTATWKRDVAHADRATVEPGTRCLIVSENGELSEHLREELEAAGRGPVLVTSSIASASADLWAGRWSTLDVVHIDGGSESLLALVQELASLRPVRLWLVSHGIQDVLDGDRSDPVQFAALGLLAMVPTEMPGIACCAIDLPPLPASRRNARWLAAELDRRIQHRALALRGGRRWIPHFETVEANEVACEPWTRGGVYLVTGLGATGTELAVFLTSTYNAHVEIVEFETPPSAAEMRIVVQRMADRFGRIRGVLVGLAGIESCPILAETSDRLRQITDSINASTQALASALEGLAPEFLAFVLSTVALIGGRDQAGQAAAAACLDAHARRLAQTMPAVSITVDEQLQPRQQVDAITALLRARVPQGIATARPIEDLLDAKPCIAASKCHSGAGENESVKSVVTSIWRGLFGIAEIGQDDSFFELGGNSLLAVQMVSRIRDAFNVELSVQRIFDSPTLAALSMAVSALRGETPEGDELDSLVAEIEALSPEEIRKELADGLSA